MQSSFSQAQVKYFFKEKNLQNPKPESFAYLISIKSKYHLHKEVLPHISCFQIHSRSNLQFRQPAHSYWEQNNKAMFAEAFKRWQIEILWPFASRVKGHKLSNRLQ